MQIVKVLTILNNHILDLERELQFKDYEIESLKKENSHLKDYVGDKYEEVK